MDDKIVAKWNDEWKKWLDDRRRQGLPIDKDAIKDKLKDMQFGEKSHFKDFFTKPKAGEGAAKVGWTEWKDAEKQVQKQAEKTAENAEKKIENKAEKAEQKLEQKLEKAAEQAEHKLEKKGEQVVEKQLEKQLEKQAGKQGAKLGAKLGKKVLKAIPFFGAAATLFFWKQDVEAKGACWGTVNSALDAAPGVGTVKGAAEIISGEEFIPDKDSAIAETFREADAAVAKTAELQANYDANIAPRIQAQMEQVARQQAAANRAKIEGQLAALKDRIAQEEALLAEARQRRAGKWFFQSTAALDTAIEFLERGLPERYQALERLQKALEATKP
jgi:hypothetical protein